jgi:hypothetical protein
MSDHAQLAGVETRVQARCSWCTTSLAAGATRCPSCGASVVDPSLSPPDAVPAAATPVAPTQPRSKLVEWWKDEPVNKDGTPVRRPLPSFAEVEQRRLQTFIAIGGAILFCAVLGWLLGPLLSGLVESITGSPVEDTNDLRPTGLFIGVLVGSMLGAIGGMVIWSGSR